jgi:hypothetical protein
MKDKLFKELEKSIKEGARILKGKQNPSREFSFENLDLKICRTQFDLSRKEKRFRNK